VLREYKLATLIFKRVLFVIVQTLLALSDSVGCA